MNVFFIERTTDGTVGGSHTCMYNLVNCLDKKYKVLVGFYQSNQYVKKIRDIGITVYIISRLPRKDGNVLIRKIYNWYKLVYLHKKELSNLITDNKIELVVINNSISDCYDIVSTCKKLHVPVITYERGYFKLKRSDIKLSYKIAASIAVSQAVKNNLVEQKYRPDIRVIYDGLPVNSSINNSGSKTGADIKENIGIPANSTVIGVIGNIREWKGQEYFAKAFMALGEKHSNMYGLVIGGHGTEDVDYIDRIKKIISRSEVGRRLIFLGFRDDVTDLLKIMDVFVHTSIKPEPFGMVLLEAMYHRVPVIATNFGGPVEILINGDCGILVPPRNENAIVDGVEKYLNNSSFRYELIEKAYKRVMDEFDLRRTVGMVENLFQEVRSKGLKGSAAQS